MRRALFLLVLLLPLGSCSRSKVGNVAIDPELVKLIPADTLTLAGGRLAAARETEAYRKYGSAGLPVLEQFRAATGVDAGKDLREFLVASNAADSLTIVRGVSAESVKAMEGKGSSSAVFGGGIGAAGPEGLLAGAVKGPRRGTIPGRLRELIEEIPTNPHFWLVTGRAPETGAIGPASSPLAAFGRVFAMLESASLWVELSDRVNVGARAHCADEETAKQMEAGLRALMGLARLSAPAGEPERLKALDAFEITQEGASVRMRGELPEQLLEALARIAGG